MSAKDVDLAQSRALVNSIAKDLGYVDKSLWDGMTPEAKKAFQYALDRKDTMITSSLSSLVQDLQTSDACFIRELLQNADDNQFSAAKERRDPPSVSFQVFHDRIIVDCNEDGFSQDDLKAICSVGGSSKLRQKSSHMKEKSMGFKSVFMAAWRVRIQSRHLSFRLTHRAGDNGLGMITPIWDEGDEDEEPVPHSATRMTLFLNTSGNEQLLAQQRQKLYEQLNELHENLLLSMKNLEQIRCSFHNDKDILEKTIVFTISAEDGPRVRLKRHLLENGKESTSSTLYYVFTHTVNNLAKDENRTDSCHEENTMMFARAIIKLAFQVSEDSEPMIEPQNILTDFPINKVGLPFLTQGDSVKHTSRQDMVISSPRNQGLLKGLVAVFVAGILELRNHPKLRYTWMRYLPDPERHRSDPFWNSFTTALATRLMSLPMLLPHSGALFGNMSELRYLEPQYLDRSGEPLLSSESNETYLSTKYEKRDIEKLEKYGLRSLELDQFISDIDKDLCSDNSRIKSQDTEIDCKDKMASLLCQPFESPDFHYLQFNVKNLPIIYLVGGTWSKPAMMNAGVYFSKCGGFSIPSHIGLNLLHPQAEGSPKLTKLMEHLGVRTASIEVVREKIVAHCANMDAGVPIAQSVENIRFLYQTDNLGSRPQGWEHILIMSSTLTRLSPFSGTLFLPGSQELDRFGALNLGSDPTDVVQLIHPDYLVDPPAKPSPLSPSWEQWLCESFAFRRVVTIVPCNTGGDLYKVAICVEKDRPQIIIGLLHYDWWEGSAEAHPPHFLREGLVTIEIPRWHGEVCPLHWTYLPLPDLKDQCAKFLREGEYFPFLELSSTITRDNMDNDWGFLHQIGVRSDNSLPFYLHMLWCILEPARDDSVTDEGRVIDLYKILHKTYLESPTPLNVEIIRQYFYDCLDIFVPTDEVTGTFGFWESVKDCRWDGPASFTKATILRKSYDRYTRIDEVAAAAIQWLFIDILDIKDVSCLDIVQELMWRRGQVGIDVYEAQDLYEYLGKLASSMNEDDKESLKAFFGQHALIFVPNSNVPPWRAAPACAWSTMANSTKNFRLLNEHYGDLENLFVDILGVPRYTAQMAYDALLTLKTKTGAGYIPHSHAISKINFLSAFLAKGPLYFWSPKFWGLDPKPVYPMKILPVKRPGSCVQLCTTEDEFAIVDKLDLGNIFADRVKTLFYDKDDHQSHLAFTSWLGLQDKYMSRLTKEVIREGKGGKRAIAASECRIRPKAKAICQAISDCTSHVLDPQHLENLERELANVTVYECDGNISTELHLTQDGKTYIHQWKTKEFHIQEVNKEELEIYVPSNKSKQEHCYANNLASELVDWIMAHPRTALHGPINDHCRAALASILNPSCATGENLLEVEGTESGAVIMDLDDPFVSVRDSRDMTIADATGSTDVGANADANADAAQESTSDMHLDNKMPLAASPVDQSLDSRRPHRGSRSPLPITQ